MGSTVLWYKKGTLLGFEYVLHLKVSNVIFQSVTGTVTGSSPGVFVRNVFGISTFEQIDSISFLQQNEYLTILKVQYDTYGLYTQTSSLTIRDSSFLEGVQFIFSQSASYVNVILENLGISHTANGALNISGSIPALYTVVFRNVSFVENIYNVSLVDSGSDTNVELVTLTDAQNVTFIDCAFSRNFFNSLEISTLVSLDSSFNVFFIRCDFFRNYGRGISYVVNLKNNSHNITFIDCNFFRNNFLGDIVALSSSLNVTFIDCNFTGNNVISGEIVFLYTSQNVTFIDCDMSGNSINIVEIYNSYNVIFINCSIYGNKGTSNSGADLTYGSMLLVGSHNVIFANCIIYANSVTAIYRIAYILYLISAQNVTFTDCIFSNNNGTPISAYNSDFTLSRTVLFSDNTAFEGGALALSGESTVYIANNTNVIFLNNTAENVGGAVFVHRSQPVTPITFPYCFLQFRAINAFSHCFQCGCKLPQFNIYFINNTAKEGGNTLYGVHVYVCQLLHINGTTCYFPDLLNSRHFYFEPSLESDLSMISSDPTRVCLCENGKPNCALVFNSGSNYTHYPGEEFSISAAVVGDMFGTVAGSAYAHILPPSKATLRDLQQSQQANSHECTKLKYSLLSEPGLVVMAITANNIPVQSYPSYSTAFGGGVIDQWFLNTPVYINITLFPCPIGFMLSNTPHPECVCDNLLHGLDVTCNITAQIIYRKGSVWISSEDNRGTRLMVSKHCPYGYCKARDVNVSLDHPDTQCTFNHSGRLCGGCQSGLSLVLGSPQCLDCSNNYHLALLIPFALAGLALVFFIKVLNLTVAEGTINGLIFYANIIQSNQAIFFPTEPVIGLYPIKVFIAWLNLDLGITTCFFDGLDGYWKTWLQFVFPLYLWAIITLIIYLSHKFQSVAKILGNNSVPVLATLIFLSYTKLLRTVITALSLSSLEVSDNSTVAVWSLDGNIDYLSEKHIPLFVVALTVLLFLWLPYTSLLLFEQCIQKISNYWVRKWMLWLKPFLDAYFGSFRGEHRYWVGVLLVARAVLLLVFGLNSTNDPRVNLLAVITVAVLLLVHLPYDTHKIVYPNGAGKHIRFWGGSYYKKWYLSLLENSFILNLLMLAAGTWYVISAKGNKTTLLYTSIGITFCQFIGIIIFHGYNQLKKLWDKWMERVQELWNINRADYEPFPDQPVGLERDQWPPYQPMNQCREPLLEDEDN